jgi:hypothetical protein
MVFLFMMKALFLKELILMKKPRYMRHVSLLAIAFFTFAQLSAQKDHTIKLKAFTALKVYDRITLTLEKGDSNILVIHGNNAYELQYTEIGELLRLKIDPDQGAVDGKIVATLFYTEQLKLINANANATIQGNNTLEQEDCEVHVQEGGMISLKVAMESVNVKAITGGAISLSGTSATQNISVSTAGHALNKSLKTKETSVMAMGGGLAEINATDLVQAQTKAGGTIKVYGNPKKIEENTTYGGQLLLMQ